MTTDWNIIQQQLCDLGCYTGRVDGIRGPITESAIQNFQGLARLSRDGLVGPRTIAALKLYLTHPDRSIARAAELVRVSYELKSKGLEAVNQDLSTRFNLSVIKSCPTKGVEAYMLSNKILLVPGSNSVWDYVKFNFRLLNIGMPRLKLGSGQKKDKKTITDNDGVIWHQGFFTHARQISDWIGTDPKDWPTLVIGHSLGAASAQILSTIWNVPSIGFAAPRIRKSEGAMIYANQSLSICREDDLVCRLPRRFDRLGDSQNLAHAKPKRGMNHKMDAYIDALRNPAVDVNIPPHWPAVPSS